MEASNSPLKEFRAVSWLGSDRAWTPGLPGPLLGVHIKSTGCSPLAKIRPPNSHLRPQCPEGLHLHDELTLTLVLLPSQVDRSEPTSISPHWLKRTPGRRTPAATAKLLQSCPTLCDPIDGSPPGSPVLGFSRQEHWSELPFPSPMGESEKWKWSRSVVSDSLPPDGL